MVENSLRMLANYLQGCTETILNWRDVLGVLLTEGSELDIQCFQMGTFFH